MSKIHDVLTSGERIVWEGKPKFWPFILSFSPALLFGLVFLAIAIFSLMAGGEASELGGYGVLGTLFGLGLFVYNVVNFPYVHYAITDKRTLIEQGVIGRDVLSIEHDQLVSTSVTVGFADKVFGGNTGSVMIIHSGSARGRYGATPVGLRSIEDPYKIYQLLNKVSHDIRTDINYPNAMRPDTNPGYKTEYKG